MKALRRKAEAPEREPRLRTASGPQLQPRLSPRLSPGLQPAHRPANVRPAVMARANSSKHRYVPPPPRFRFSGELWLTQTVCSPHGPGVPDAASSAEALSWSVMPCPGCEVRVIFQKAPLACWESELKPSPKAEVGDGELREARRHGRALARSRALSRDREPAADGRRRPAPTERAPRFQGALSAPPAARRVHGQDARPAASHLSCHDETRRSVLDLGDHPAVPGSQLRDPFEVIVLELPDLGLLGEEGFQPLLLLLVELELL